MAERALRRIFGWLGSRGERRPRYKVPRAWVHCPICDRKLVGPYNPGGHGMTFRLGVISTPPNRHELIAKCPVHGRRPYNDPERKPATDWVGDDEWPNPPSGA
ncbi:MAG TPA: hypothetical protein VGQ20_04695 [Acidimicrobiales bacterium]|nr:hypothetical protein [Acidimicrobiales bacterium]